MIFILKLTLIIVMQYILTIINTFSIDLKFLVKYKKVINMRPPTSYNIKFFLNPL